VSLSVGQESHYIGWEHRLLPLRPAQLPRLARSFLDVRLVQSEARRQLAELGLMGPPPREAATPPRPGPRPQVAQPVAWQTMTPQRPPGGTLFAVPVFGQRTDEQQRQPGLNPLPVPLLQPQIGPQLVRPVASRPPARQWGA
jgi:hypothetical protein